MDDNKYIVFKREVFDKMLAEIPLSISEADYPYVQDAVVIRTKDRFAGTALRTYADTVSNAIELMVESGVEVPSGLIEVRDYFYGKSDDAYSSPVKRIPD